MNAQAPLPPDSAGATPVMVQFFEAKARQPDALVFFRMGDFYELFFEDAEKAAAALGITLTARGNHGGAPIPMCGVPVHAAENCRRLVLFALLMAALHLDMVAPGARAQTSVTTQEVIPPFEKEILAFEASDKTNPPPQGAVLFIGSSSIRLWKTLTTDFQKQKVINRGFGGSQISDSVNYAGRIAIPYHPRLIVFYAGGNDLHGGKTPERVFADYKAFVAKIHAALPRTRIAYISIAGNPSRWSEVERVKEANRLIEAQTKTDSRLQFINVFPRMLGEDGQPRPEIFVADRLHMNERGYQLWKEIVGPHLD